jgi:hypothetical protein
MNKVNRNGVFNLASRQPIDREYARNEQKIDNSRDSHIYFNITLINNTGAANPAQYAELRSDPLLINPEDYHMSIERFSIPTIMVPLDINSCFSTPGSSVFGNTKLGNSVTIAYSGAYSQVYFGTGSMGNFPDYTGSVPYPIGITQSSQLSFNYYQSVCDIFNNSISSAETNMKSQRAMYNADFTPFFTYDNSQSIFRINTPRQYDVNLGSTAPQLWVNNVAYLKINSIPAMANNQPIMPNPTGCDYQIKCRNAGGPASGNINGLTLLSIPNSLTGGVFITGNSNPQEFNNLANLNTMNTLQLLTNDIPVTPQGINNQSAGTLSDQSALIFTNFGTITSQGSDIRNFANFFVQGERRLIDLQGNDPLRKLSFNLYWADSAQHLTQVYIPPYYSVDVLVLFIKKGQYH